jgi:hypothetical protein
LLKSNVLASGAVTPIDCLHYSLNVPVSVQITGVNSQMLLDQAFAAAKTFRPMDESEVAALIAKTEQARKTACMNCSIQLRTSTPRHGILTGRGRMRGRCRRWRRSCQHEATLQSGLACADYAL